MGQNQDSGKEKVQLNLTIYLLYINDKYYQLSLYQPKDNKYYRRLISSSDPVLQNQKAQEFIDYIQKNHEIKPIEEENIELKFKLNEKDYSYVLYNIKNSNLLDLKLFVPLDYFFIYLFFTIFFSFFVSLNYRLLYWGRIIHAIFVFNVIIPYYDTRRSQISRNWPKSFNSDECKNHLRGCIIINFLSIICLFFMNLSNFVRFYFISTFIVEVILDKMIEESFSKQPNMDKFSNNEEKEEKKKKKKEDDEIKQMIAFGILKFCL